MKLLATDRPDTEVSPNREAPPATEGTLVKGRVPAPSSDEVSETVVPGKAANQTAIWRSRWIAALPFFLLLPLFASISWGKATRSNSGVTDRGYHVIFDFDQHPYLNMARMMRITSYSRTVPRHRMPGYSVLLSPLYLASDAYPVDPTGKDPRGVSDAYFARAKLFNILVSCLCLVLIYLVSRRFLPPLESHVITWGFGMAVAIFKAPYVQPEVLFYTLFLMGVIGVWTLLRRPSWLLAVVTGLILAAAFLLKSTVLPLLVLFLFCAGLRYVADTWQWWQRASLLRAGGEREPLRRLAIAALVPAVFVVTLLPFFRNNVEMYGKPHWDVHSQHYMWMESDGEKRYWRNAGISNPDFSPPAGESPPTAKTWFEKHTLSDAVSRIEKGWENNRKLIKRYYPGAYLLMKRVGIVLLLATAALFWRRTRRLIYAHWIELIMIVGFFAGYGLLYSWYQAINVGPRLILALFLPAFFFLVFALHRYTNPVMIRVGNLEAPLRVIISAILLLSIVYGAVDAFSTGHYWTVEGGR